MASRVSRTVSTARSSFAVFGEKNVAFMAGSIAYNAFVSLIPLLLLLVLAVSVAGSGQLEARVTEWAMGSLTPAAGEVVGEALSGADEEGGAGISVVGLVVLVWGTLKIFRGLDTAFSEIFETAAESSFLDQLRDSLVVLAALGLAVGAMVVASAAFAALRSIPYIGLLNPLLLVVGLSLAFFPLFYVFPDADLTPRQVLPGLLVAAVGWAALQALFQVYIAYADKSDAYGVLGGILLLVTWLYLGGLVLLLGAVVNAVVNGYAAAATEPEDDQAGERRLAGDDLTTYLRRLREGLSGRYEEMRPSVGERFPRPADGAVEVSERVLNRRGEGEGPIREVTLRWRVDEGREADGAGAPGGRRGRRTDE